MKDEQEANGCAIHFPMMRMRMIYQNQLAIGALLAIQARRPLPILLDQLLPQVAVKSDHDLAASMVRASLVDRQALVELRQQLMPMSDQMHLKSLLHMVVQRALLVPTLTVGPRAASISRATTQ